MQDWTEKILINLDFRNDFFPTYLQLCVARCQKNTGTSSIACGQKATIRFRTSVQYFACYLLHMSIPEFWKETRKVVLDHDFMTHKAKQKKGYKIWKTRNVYLLVCKLPFIASGSPLYKIEVSTLEAPLYRVKTK